MIDFVIDSKDRFVDFYLRLSKDDRNKGLSISIENQNKILTRFATDHHYTIRHRYIDDGESGYSFDRPDFDKLKTDIASGKVKRLLIKDMSRLGRHNARALLFMEEAKDYGCEVIALDDGYSNYQDNDVTIGIKTWHNELYVKEASRKVRNVIRMKQDNGEWLSTPPFGYRKIKSKSSKIEIDPENAEIVKRIFDLYAGGYGMMKIARILTRENILTPSRTLHEHRIQNGIKDKSKYSDVWNDQCIRRILTNETYLGTLLQHQGECIKIRGKYQKQSKDQWKRFENHHEAIIDKKLFQECQEKLANKKIRSKRTRKEYEDVFHGLLYCAGCENLLKPVRTAKDRKSGNVHYYCSTYLKQGKDVCSAKSTTEQDLKQAVTIFLKRCTMEYQSELKAKHIHVNKNETEVLRLSKKMDAAKKHITKLKSEITQLIENKMHESLNQSDNYEIIQDSYETLINDKAKLITEYEQNIQRYQNAINNHSSQAEHDISAYDVIEEMMAKQDYTKEELQILFKKIIVNENRIVFYCNGDIPDHIDTTVNIVDPTQNDDRTAILKEIENQAVNQLFSLKSVYSALKEQGYAHSYKGRFMKQIQQLEKEGIVERPHKNKKAIYLGQSH